ncbi:MAG: carbohydrate ABC transporter permease [Candidatus Marinimicrobia bacterium]|nr:carbohydrate ABC transporter permease [Candidatus Neomarinimicrobiota bacterium]
MLKKSTSKRLVDYLSYILLILTGIVVILPFVWMILSSFKTAGEIWTFPPVFMPKKFQWSNYVEAWKALPFDRFFINSLLVTIFVTVGQLFTCSLGGYAFARLRFPGKDKLFLMYLATMMIPFPVLMIPLFIIMQSFGWIDTLKSIIVPGLFSAWGTFLMRQFMMGIPRTLEDAAKIDGCSYWRLYWKIIVPLCKPVFATLGIFTFMGTWNQFFWPLIMINTISNKTLPLGLVMFQTRIAAETPWHLIMAASCATVLPIIILFIIGQKYYVKGIVTSGLKG